MWSIETLVVLNERQEQKERLEESEGEKEFEDTRNDYKKD
jgi:hypothetical protein